MEPLFQKFLSSKVPTVSAKSAQSVLDLHKEGATVPFIARYRKEKTGNLDEVQIRDVITTLETFEEIVKRKDFLLKEIGEQGNLTEELKKRIDTAWDLGDLEEIYRPFKKKKKTKATIAREAGLEPLANWIWDVGHGTVPEEVTMEVKAKGFLNLQGGIASYELALKGAQDIIIEKIANDPVLREMVKKSYVEQGKLSSKRTKSFKPHSKYEMYAEFQENVKSLIESKNSHRYLAMRRGWQEEELALEVTADDAALLQSYERFATTTPDNNIGDYLKQAAKMALTVYVLPSIHNEVHRWLKDKADEDATKVFAENVRRLLLASPFGAKVVLGVDPGLKSGCKIALVDKSGQYISHTVMQILGENAEAEATTLFTEVTKQIQIESIAVGNGTAGRQAEIFIRKILKDIGKDIPVIMVSESGASVYSASEIARQEFPDLDLTVKGAISIARRLQDPLAELVKVDPKSIGVGQYQHDINATTLKKSLEAVVESCVNSVGVDLNTASASLLSYVAGIGPSLAQGVVEFRKKQLFTDRTELLKVPKFSTKAFEQAAGFLRIASGKVYLDSTGIHPERYTAIRDMAQELSVPLTELTGGGAKKLLALRTKWISIIGEFTFDDIVAELEKPGRDPRDPFKIFHFRDDIFEVKDLKVGLICPGIVTNVTNFGAFVDIGVHQDGLAHISELSHKFIDDPRKVVNPGDQVTVRVIGVDLEKNQIALSMKMEAPAQRQDEHAARPPRERQPNGDRQQDRGRGPDRGRGGPGPSRGPRPALADGANRGGQNAGAPRDARAQGDANRGGRDRPRNDGDRPRSDGDHQSRPDGRGPQRGDSRDQRRDSRGGPPRDDRGQGQRSPGGAPGRAPGKPFNNPFAALLDVNKK